MMLFVDRERALVKNTSLAPYAFVPGLPKEAWLPPRISQRLQVGFLSFTSPHNNDDIVCIKRESRLFLSLYEVPVSFSKCSPV